MSKFTDTLKTPLRWMGLASKPKGTTITSSTSAATRASGSIKAKAKRSVSYEINDIKTALTLASKPDLPTRTKLYEIYYYILQDGHLSSQLQIAIQKVLAEPFGLYTGETLDKDATNLLQTPWMEMLMTHILESEFFGFRMVELVITNGVVELELIPNENVCPEFETIWFTEPFAKPNLPYSGIAQDLNLLFFGSKKDVGVLHKAAYNVLWKFYARSDWSRASEKFGMPILHIKANTNNDTELDRLEHQAATFGTDGFLVTQDGDDATVIERKGEKSHGIYAENIVYCDEQVSKLINGQTGASDNKAFAGSAEVHERLMEDLTFARMRRVRFAFNTIALPFLKKRELLSDAITEFDYVRFKQPAKAVIDDTEPKPDPTTDPVTKPIPNKNKRKK